MAALRVVAGVWLTVALALAAPACSKQPRSTSSPTPHPSVLEVVVVDAAAPGPDATLQSPFDAVDTHCSVDADCDVVTIEVTGVHACCSSCATTAGNKGWAERLRAACAARPPGICFPLGCPMGPTHTRCDAGRCVLEAGP
ncbi:MAG: hypothetical protein IT370_04960 [Deltaproteobacteria bacterium]|nr:hypothetical protein [Deltaproteobacteria bacterium]